MLAKTRIVAIVSMLALGGCGPETRTITGRVLDAFATPVSSAKVIASAKANTVTTTAGVFTIPDVKIPYDLTVITADRHYVYIYEDMTRPDPTVPISVATVRAASVSGRLTGAHFPQTSSYASSVGFSSLEAIAMAVSASVDGSFSFPTQSPLVWGGPESTYGKLHAVQWQVGGDGLPVAYQYGSRVVGTLQHQGIYSGQNIALTAVPNVLVLGGTIMLPSGYTLVAKELYLRLDDHSLLPIFTDRSLATTFSYKVPDIAGASCVLLVVARQGSSELAVFKTALRSGNISVEIPAAATAAQAPLDAAAGVNTSTTFGWSGLGGMFELRLAPNNSSQPYYLVKTNARTFKLPDLSQQGVSTPRAAAYRWQVIEDLTFNNSDAATGAEGLDYFEQQISLKFKRDFVQAVSEIRSFTTAP